ncbi:hypothetical protein M2103_002684 [Ereboglobus sp. PH5-5]|nr:hypothetical protein [Ereboglobus sp. PH5-5]
MVKFIKKLLEQKGVGAIVRTPFKRGASKTPPKREVL